MQSWQEIARGLKSQPPRTSIRVLRTAVAHPAHAGLRRTVGVPRGQVADYRLPLGTDSWLHVTEYSKEYVVHREVRAARQEPRPPASKGDSGALLGFFVGLALGGSVGAALAGLALGAVVDADAKQTRPAPPSKPGAKRRTKTGSRTGSARKA